MDLALITMKQVGVLFILIAVGYACVRANVLKAEWRQAFSNLLLYAVTPCLVINSYFSEYDQQIFASLMKTFGLSTVLLLLGIVITLIAGVWIKGENKPIILFGCSFSNAAYMGFPLIGALFGQEGLLYASAFFTIFNILLWTFGYSIVSRKVKPKEIFKAIVTQPVIYTVILGLIIYFLRIPVPDIIAQPISNIAGMNTPLSMIITGMIIAATDTSALVKNKSLFFIIVVRMLLVPAACFGLFYILGLNSIYAKIVLLLEACPTAAITSVFAVRYNYEEDLAAGAVVITTLLSIITLPFWAFLMTTLM